MRTRDIVSEKLAKIEAAIKEFEEETGILISSINRRYDYFSGTPVLMDNKVEFANMGMERINQQWPPSEKVKKPKTHTT